MARAPGIVLGTILVCALLFAFWLHHGHHAHLDSAPAPDAEGRIAVLKARIESGPYDEGARYTWAP